MKIDIKREYQQHFPNGKIRTIFLHNNNWERFKDSNKVRKTEDENVLNMLACRTPLLGKHIYNCPNCDYKLEIPHSCKSRFCSVCGYIATENWIRERFNFLLNCHYHHIVVTIPAGIKWITKLDRTLTLNFFAKTAAETILYWARERGYEPSIVSFFHSFGSNLQYHPHFHLVVSAGGLKPNGEWYYTDEKYPGSILMPIFRKKFISGIYKFFIEDKLKTNSNLKVLFSKINNISKEHWQFYTERITKRDYATMTYCARYAKKMIISEHRIIDYDGKHVTFFNTKHKVLVWEVDMFIKCVIQHIPEKNFRFIRYYGFYSNKSKKKYDLALNYWQTLKKKEEKQNWRERQTCRNASNVNYEEKSFDPFICPNCSTELKLTEIVYPEPKYKRTFEAISFIFGLDFQSKLKLDYG